MTDFFSRLLADPRKAIDAASITRVDELGNGYDDFGQLIAPKFEQPQQTWGETALGVATAPARMATALAGSVSPYGADGWQVPPIAQEGWNALTAVGDAYTQGMDQDEINNRALGMAGFMMGGGGLAARPAGGTGMFAGRLARTADQEALARAEKMAAEGADRNAIWNETGWFQGPDQKWRFEIDDSGMAHRIKPTEWIPERVPGKPWMAPNVETAANKAMDGLSPSAPLRVKRLFDHNELETAYPNGFHYNSPDYQHQGITGMRVNLIEGEGPDAAFMGDRIALHEKLTPGIAKEATLHELQHAIQQHEGFARGGNRSLFTPEEIASERARIGAVPEDKTGWTSVGSAAGDAPDTDVALGLYKRLAGETEARNVQTRMNMSADERRATPPWDTQDIPDIDQIIRLYSNASKESSIPAIASALGRSDPVIEQVWGPKFDILMGQQYRMAEAGSDLSTMYDRLAAKLSKASGIEPDMRAAMEAKRAELLNDMGPEGRRAAGIPDAPIQGVLAANADSRPALLASALDMSPEARAERIKAAIRSRMRGDK